MYTTPSAFLVVNRFLLNLAGRTVPDDFGPMLTAFVTQYEGGGWLGLDGNGDLLAATGDGRTFNGSAGSQDDRSPLGKVLRFGRNPDPFAGASPNSSRPSYSPRACVDRTGNAPCRRPADRGRVTRDGGRDAVEEVDYLDLTGTTATFGWPFKEGTRVVVGDAPAGLIDPVIEYSRGAGMRAGQAVIGGVIVGGSGAVPALRDS